RGRLQDLRRELPRRRSPRAHPRRGGAHRAGRAGRELTPPYIQRMAEISIGSVLGGYRVEGVAGEGGMGRVYRATQIGLGRQVALKLIMPELAMEPDFRERFARESRLTAAIEHPNVIPVYEAGEADGHLFI